MRSERRPVALDSQCPKSMPLPQARAPARAGHYPRRVPVTWKPAGEYSDIRYELSGDGIAKITIDRPEVRNAFRPQTLIQISDALGRARGDLDVGVIILTGEGDEAFCSGGDQRVRCDAGYLAEDGA